jgi:hypothetical protein
MCQRVALGLPAEAYQNYRGQWIALTSDGMRIVAGAENLDALENQLVAQGEDAEKLRFDYVENDDLYLGGAELI